MPYFPQVGGRDKVDASYFPQVRGRDKVVGNTEASYELMDPFRLLLVWNIKNMLTKRIQ